MRSRTNSPGVSAPSRVVEDRADADRAGRGIELVVEEVQAALACELVVTGQRHPDGHGPSVRGPFAAGLREERRLVGVEGGVHRVDRHDRRQQRALAGAARHQVAFGDDGAADAAGDRRDHARELEVQFGGAQRRFDAGDLRHDLLGKRDATLDLLAGHRVLRGEPPGAIELGLRAPLGRSRALQFGAQAVDLGLKGARVDLEQQVALADQGAFAEPDVRDVAGDAGTDLDRVDGLEAAGELVPLGDLAGRRPRRR